MFRGAVLYNDIYIVEKSRKVVGVKWCVIHKELTNKEAWTVLCSVVKHAGSGRARKKRRGKHPT